MNMFQKLIADQSREERRLGNPLPTPEARERRMNYFASMTGGNGFRTPPKPLKTDAQGRTRGEREREARDFAKAAMKLAQSEPRS